jgi:hypothetical protein
MFKFNDFSHQASSCDSENRDGILTSFKKAHQAHQGMTEIPNFTLMVSTKHEQ